MAQISITVADNKEADILAAFGAMYANPDNLTPQQLMKLHIKNYVRSVLRDYQKKTAYAAVEANLASVEDI